ncbi:hypothetical protein SDC9_58320 [bioreactor metagenome]|uniref:Uncharacterized protein n=1 Tax=bioreactor metagenome TaxID=1076179 RepID=A0A644X7B8_9ZZZZ|nr:hypothetical protein [Oscillibacter sp.]MEA4994396.1 hypothetical protein [Oscillibacter sp.]
MSELWERALPGLLVLERSIFRKLSEVIGITRELAEAVDREDQVSVRMLLTGRHRPLLELQELNAALELKRCDLSGEDEAAFDRLLKQSGPPRSEAEREAAEQIAQNRRALEQLAELDRHVNEKLCRDKSFYRKR